MTSQSRSLFLLVSLLLFFVLTPFLQDSHAGEGFLVGSTYLTLVAGTMELSSNRGLFWSALPLALASMVSLLASHFYFYQIRWLLLVSDSVLAAFLALVSIALFSYLLRPGAITKGRLYISVSLYFLIGLSWSVVYRLINTVQPGSFAESHVPVLGNSEPSKLLYFSLATLTTLGYGDIVPVRPGARMLATMEAAAGVLYIAIFVASLVASYQQPSHATMAHAKSERSL